ncbi:MAG: hypothetical protein GVY26_08390 [Bacteroidetes bacterium]|nr:hypothetical protein [Bacteroidota bacterium]
MPQYRYSFNSSNNNPFSTLIGIVLGVLFLLGLFFIARFIFTILYYLSPIMLIVALIVDYKVVTGYGKWLLRLTKDNALLGIGAILLTVLGFPLVSLFLLGKALLRKRVKDAQEEAMQQREGEYIEYEELDSEPMDLPQIEEWEKQTEERRRKRNDYDDFFDSQS